MRDVFDTKYLKSKNINAEYVKAYYKFKPVGHYDIYNGKTVTIRSKDGREIFDTGLTPNQFFEKFGGVKVKEKD